jgi:hypothetical protein
MRRRTATRSWGPSSSSGSATCGSAWYGEPAERRGLGRTSSIKDLTYQRDLGWLLAHNPVNAARPYADEGRAGREFVITNPPAKANNFIDIGFDPNRNGDAVGYISVLGVGGGAFIIGKSGLTVAAGVTLAGSGMVPVNDKGLAVGFTGPGYGPLQVNARFVAGPNGTTLDADVGLMRVSLFGTGAGVYLGGQRVSFGSLANVSAVNLQSTPADVARLLQGGFGAGVGDIARVLNTNLRVGMSDVAVTLRGLTKDLSEIAKALKPLGADMGKMAAVLGADLSILDKGVRQTWTKAGQYISQTLNSAGQVLKEWIYYDEAGKKLYQWRAWAGGKLTNLDRYTASGVRTLQAYISTTGNWVERTYTNGVETAVRVWNSAGNYLGDQLKNFSDATSKLDPTTTSWWPF